MPKLIVGLVSLTFVCLNGHSQESFPLDLGFGPGAAVYQGDLSPQRFGSFRRAGPGFQLFSAVQFHPNISLRASFSFALLEESDKNYPSGFHQHRNFYFQTIVNELSFQVVLHPAAVSSSDAAVRVQPYAFCGAGWARLTIDRDWSGFDYKWPQWQLWVREGLASDSATSLPGATIVFPAGLGIRISIGEKFSLFVEAAHRFTKEEYLDGFSKAANPGKRDAYTLFTTGVVFSRSLATTKPERRVY